MNILPLVLGFLLLLSVLSASFFSQTLSTLWEEKALRGYFYAKRRAYNKLESRSFAKICTETPSSSSSSHSFSYVSRREKPALTTFSKLNLASLFAQQSPSPFLYETAAQLLRLLYQDTSLSKQGLPKGFEYLLLDHWMGKAKQDKEIDSFAALYPQDPKLSTLFYKMLKGTRKYSLEDHSGYPPLEDFFCIDSSKQPIFFHFASKPLLTVLFGSKVMEEILKIEKEKWEKDGKDHSLTKEELRALLSSAPKFPLTALEEHFNFTKKRSLLEVVIGKDPASGIDVKKQI